MAVNVMNRVEKIVIFCAINSLINIHFGTNAIVGGIPLNNRIKKNNTCVPIVFFITELFLKDLFLRIKLIIATEEK